MAKDTDRDVVGFDPQERTSDDAQAGGGALELELFGDCNAGGVDDQLEAAIDHEVGFAHTRDVEVDGDANFASQACVGDQEEAIDFGDRNDIGDFDKAVLYANT